MDEMGAHASANRISTLAFCYSVAEYACLVWQRLAHTHHLDPELNQAECLAVSSVEDLLLLVGIAQQEIRTKICTSVEKKKQNSNEAHSLFGQISAEKCM